MYLLQNQEIFKVKEILMWFGFFSSPFNFLSCECALQSHIESSIFICQVENQNIFSVKHCNKHCLAHLSSVENPLEASGWYFRCLCLVAETSRICGLFWKLICKKPESLIGFLNCFSSSFGLVLQASLYSFNNP